MKLPRKTVLVGVLGLSGLIPGALSLQNVIDAKVSNRLRNVGASVEPVERAGTVVVGAFASPAHRTPFALFSGARLNTSLVRRRCDGALTWGTGATVRLGHFSGAIKISTRTTVTLKGSGVCLDATFSPYLGTIGFEAKQAEAVALEGVCGPTISGLEVRLSKDGQLEGRVGLTDSSHCLEKLSLVAPNFPKDLVPEKVALEFSSSGVDFRQRELKGKSGVALAAEFATRVRSADLKWGIEVQTNSGETVAACFRKSEVGPRSEFEVALGLSTSTLKKLSSPFFEQETREILADLRADRAVCDGSGAGLAFDSDLSQVRLRGNALQRLPHNLARGASYRSGSCTKIGGTTGPCRYDLAVIGFDEKGAHTDEAQLKRVLGVIEGEAQRGVLLSVFMHGWRHSAHEDDSNRAAFEKWVAALAALEAELPAEKQRRVIGVYLGWPGRVFASPSANKLATFWNRLEVANQLGQPGGALSKTLNSLSLATRHLRSRSDNARSTAMTVSAHSMGAQAVLGAVRDADAASAPLGDLVLLVNPAVSAATYQKIEPLLEDAHTPVISFGSVADQVNQQFYAIGGALTFSGKNRDELIDHTTTVTNMPDLVTHRLNLVAPENDKAEILRAPFGLMGSDRPSDPKNFWDFSIYREPSPSGSGEAAPLPPEKWYRMVLCEHRDGAALDAPCTETLPQNARELSHMVVAVDEYAIPNHSDFFTAPFMNYVIRLTAAKLAAETAHAR